MTPLTNHGIRLPEPPSAKMNAMLPLDKAVCAAGAPGRVVGVPPRVRPGAEPLVDADLSLRPTSAFERRATAKARVS